MRLVAMIYISIFIKIGSGIQKLIKRVYTYRNRHTQGQEVDFLSQLLFFENKESRLKRGSLAS
jgi:hypothetical protein